MTPPPDAKADWKQWVRKSTRFERVEVRGPWREKFTVLSAMREEGWKTVGMVRIESGEFHFTATKEIPRGN